ncbi:hypothetical protein TNCV_4564251 [Trichonephila clavipes]|nr:hypothetical protein TNCV_4564251 [Trichonephila clavipes]
MPPTQGFLCHEICRFLLCGRHESELHFLSRFKLDENHFAWEISTLVTEKNSSSFLWCPRLMFSASKLSYLSCWMQSKGHTSLDARCKGQSLQDGCRAFAWKFFPQTHLKGHEHAEELFPTYVDVRLKPSSDTLQILMLCCDLGLLSW